MEDELLNVEFEAVRKNNKLGMYARFMNESLRPVEDKPAHCFYHLSEEPQVLIPRNAEYVHHCGEYISYVDKDAWKLHIITMDADRKILLERTEKMKERGGDFVGIVGGRVCFKRNQELVIVDEDGRETRSRHRMHSGGQMKSSKNFFYTFMMNEMKISPKEELGEVRTIALERSCAFSCSVDDFIVLWNRGFPHAYIVIASTGEWRRVAGVFPPPIFSGDIMGADLTVANGQYYLTLRLFGDATDIVPYAFRANITAFLSQWQPRDSKSIKNSSLATATSASNGEVQTLKRRVIELEDALDNEKRRREDAEGKMRNEMNSNVESVKAQMDKEMAKLKTMILVCTGRKNLNEVKKANEQEQQCQGERSIKSET